MAVAALVASEPVGSIDPGEPEVEDFHRAVGTHLDVRRLQIAVNDSDSVGRLETGRDLGGGAERFVERQRPSGQPLVEPFSLDQLEDQVESALRFLDAVEGREVRVVQRAQETGLALEPRPPFLVARERIGKGLDRHLAPEPRVPRPVHLPIPPAPIGATISYGPKRVPAVRGTARDS